MRPMLLVALVISMSFASGVHASPFSMPPLSLPPFEDIPPRPDVVLDGGPPFDLDFETPVGPPSSIPLGPGFDAPVVRSLLEWAITLSSAVTGRDMEVPLGPPADLPPVMGPPFALDRPPFSEFPPDFEAPPFFDFLPPGMQVRPIFAAPAPAVFRSVPEPTTGLLLGMGLMGMAWIGRKKGRTYGYVS